MVSLGLSPRSAFIIARVCLERGDVIFLDQGEMRDPALRLLHVLGDLAAEADDLDRPRPAAAAPAPRDDAAAIVEQIGVEIGVADAVARDISPGPGRCRGRGRVRGPRARRAPSRGIGLRVEADAAPGSAAPPARLWRARHSPSRALGLAGVVACAALAVARRSSASTSVVGTISSSASGTSAMPSAIGSSARRGSARLRSRSPPAPSRSGSCRRPRRQLPAPCRRPAIPSRPSPCRSSCRRAAGPPRPVADLDVPGDDLGLGNAFADVGQLEFEARHDGSVLQCLS